MSPQLCSNRVNCGMSRTLAGPIPSLNLRRRLIWPPLAACQGLRSLNLCECCIIYVKHQSKILYMLYWEIGEFIVCVVWWLYVKGLPILFMNPTNCLDLDLEFWPAAILVLLPRKSRRGWGEELFLPSRILLLKIISCFE